LVNAKLVGCLRQKKEHGCLINSQALFQQILCGGALQDKLLGAELNFEQIDWSNEEFRLNQIPELPGRGFVGKLESGADTGFPKKTKLILENEEGMRERGRLLHYFANHELLAIETMALTLLRFPLAPLEFKKGVFKTLQDEQRHMKLYLSRMEEYGVKLGDAPFSYYFWNRLRDMQKPLDFVVRMSLTFEQANLDFALEYAKIFEQEMDDPKTAQLLRVVHDDEVKHVGHGVKWFKEWNQDEIASEGEWGAYLKQLPYPLNARRAKGSVFFSEESRKLAGFSDAFIQSVKIAGGSRGRVPDYYLFNPECEIEADLPDLPKVLREKIEDLAPVMLWLAHGEDVVELSRRPSLEFQKQMFEYKGELPEMVTVPGCELVESIKPWGWGRRAWAHLDTWKSQVRKHPTFTAEQMSHDFFSKVYWKPFSEGLVIRSLKEFESWLKMNAGLNDEYIFKLSHSTSGRGHVVFKPSCIDEEVKKILARKNLEGVLEPYYSKLADFSIQYEIQSLPEGLKIKRFEPRFFFVDDHLQYLGAWLGAIPQTHELFPVWQVLEKNRELITKAHEPILQHLISKGYVGPVGIDALVTTDLKVVPVIEVNVRYTMGRVAHSIEAALRKKGITSPAQMKFHSKQELKKKNLKSFDELAAEFQPKSYFPVTPIDSAVSTWVAVHF
jgi:uncharacterized ferritin-like protein (DUF455 family)